VTDERREPGQVVNLSNTEHLRNAFWMIMATMLVGGIFSVNQVWSQTAINTRDIDRHERSIAASVKDIGEIKQGIARIEQALKNDRRK
jgi:hypothetical protein